MENLARILDSFHPGSTQSEYIGSLMRIVREFVIPSYPVLEARIENNKAQFSEGWEGLFLALKDARILAYFVPTQYGGLKASEQDIYVMMELFGYSSPGLGVIFVSHGRAIDLILHGTEEQKQRFLPRLAHSEIGAIAMTEEKAGSDASAIGLMAKRDGDRFVLNGEKVFISNSGLAQIYTILARTKEEKGPRSLSTLVVEHGLEGFSIKDLPKKEGLRVLPTGRLVFRNTKVPSLNLVGEEERGLLLALDVIDRGRIHIAGICCGLSYRIFREIYRFAYRRRQFDHPLTSSQDISFQIADMYCQMNAARGLCFHALNQVGTPNYRLSSSQAKLFATRAVMDVASRAQVLMGGRGYLRNSLINQLCADARGMEYLEGTSNVQKMIMGRELFRIYHKEANNLG
ncbi:MAG: acyl-CoA dehydrogenase family protein [Deltaproteobacteria bacterium]|nr:acyl-CoA dehydrogenase family protein [Deltaproteobacteria bacterium]MBW2026469.1 acyl-CoA dehydrogenase family protein [Deltaproteobacteria bacterium]MBW2126604.1 acyl-CoA dehydrogenase family protein [Deltaproteobacteria bacterium]